MNIAAAIQWIYNRPKEERLIFITETFYVTEIYAKELIKSLEDFEYILVKNMEPICE